jgi:2-furoate---CoA ligase
MFDLGRTFLQSVERRPHRLALVDGEVRLTYAQWYERIVRVAGTLDAMGLARGDHLLAVLQNRWEMATLHWACQFLGVIMTPVNWRAKGDELEHYARDADAKAVAYEPVSAEAVADCAACKGIPRIAVGKATGGTHAFADLLEGTPLEQPFRAGPEDISLMLYTSGTTGKPKGVPRRHRAERAAAIAQVAQYSYGVGEVTLGVMPLYHTMGVRSLLSMAIVDGTLVCLPRVDAADALRLIQGEKVTNLFLVPTLYHDLLSHASFAGTEIGSVTTIGFAGAPMNDALLQRLSAAFEPKLFINHYGSSEIYTFTIDRDAPAKPGSAGRAGFNCRIRVARLDAGSGKSRPGDLVAPGEEGEIIADLSGEEAFEGYWNRPDADRKSLREGWYFTGDTGFVDKDGDLFVTGRVDDMIISGGENISPVDIESVLSLHPAVDEVAVAGLPDERWGQKVVAFVKTSIPVDAAVLDAHCRNSALPNYKRPRDYVFVLSVPKSPVGKILRRKLVSGEYDKA